MGIGTLCRLRHTNKHLKFQLKAFTFLTQCATLYLGMQKDKFSDGCTFIANDRLPDGSNTELHFDYNDSCSCCQYKYNVLDRKFNCRACGASCCNNCLTSVTFATKTVKLCKFCSATASFDIDAPTPTI